MNTQEHYNINDKWLSTAEFAEDCNKFFSNVAADVLPIWSEAVHSNTAITATTVPINEVTNRLKLINTTKACHTCDFPSWISRRTADDLAVPVTNIINCMLKDATFPTLWKSYTLRPLAKHKNPTAYGDYRPIALGYHLGKVAESFIIDQLKHHITISDNQFAYREGSSTTHALVRLLHDWTGQLEKPAVSHINSLFVDMSKAFDRLNPTTLLKKLLHMGVDNNVASLIMSYLTNRLHQVTVRDTTSSVLSISVGIPQGSKLGPLLWLLYIDDMKPDHCMIKYADDCSLYMPVLRNRNSSQLQQSQPQQSQLQQAADSIQSWCSANDMMINAKKSMVMQIKSINSQSSIVPANIVLNNAVLENVSDTKVLGVIFDNNLNFKLHVQHILKKSQSKLHILKVLSSHGVDSESRLKFYKACILPGLLYAIEAWYNFLTEADKSKLESFRNLALKYIFSSYDCYEERLEAGKLLSIKKFYSQRQTRLFYNIILNETGPLHQLLESYRNNNRRSARGHTSSEFSFIAKTKLFKQSFFIHNFLLLNN